MPYTYVDVDADPEALEMMKSLNGGRQSIPVVVFPDGHHLTEPSDPALAAGLGAAGLLPGDPLDRSARQDQRPRAHAALV